MAEEKPKGGPGVPIDVAAMKRAREGKGWSQKKLAEEVGCDPRNIERIESRGTASLQSLADIAEALGVEPESLRPSEAPRPFQLPAPLGDFTGREDEVLGLAMWLGGDDSRARVCALRGMGGVGKTTLAVEVAHRVKGHFPDGQLMVDLQGMSDQPLTVVAAMSRVIRDFRPEIKSLPGTMTDLLPIYRSALAGKRALILFDNAKDEEQVQHLVTLPPPVGIIVTCRSVLALDAVEVLGVDALAPEHALGLLRTIVKDKGKDSELLAVAQLCGQLPLALRVAGDFLRLHPNWAVSRYITALSDENRRLEQLKGKTKEKDVEAVLGLSARQLAVENESLAGRWQILSICPSGFGAKVAGILWGLRAHGEVDTDYALIEITALLDRSLVQFVREGVYTFHDLMRPVARAAFDYGGGHRLQASSGLRLQIAERRMLEALLFMSMGSGPDWLKEKVLSRDEVIQLVEQELFCIESQEVIARNQAILTGGGRPSGPRRVVDLAALRLQEHRLEIETIHSGETDPLELGATHQARGDMTKAAECYEQCLVIATDAGDLQRKCAALLALGSIYAEWDKKKAVVLYFEPALAVAQEAGDRRAEAATLLALARSPSSLIDLEPRQYVEMAISIFKAIGDDEKSEEARRLLPK